MIDFFHVFKESCPVAGGHIRLSVIPVESVDSLTKDNGESGHNVSGITLAGGTAWFEWKFASESTDYREKPKQSSSGQYYEWSLDIFISKDQEYISRTIKAYQNGKFILILDDGNNQSKVLGSLKAPARLQAGIVQAGKGSGKHGYNVTFYGKSRHENYFFTGSITVASYAVSGYIDSNGYLIVDYTNDPTLSFTIDSNGYLIGTGPNAHRYSIDSNGYLIFT